MIKKKKKPSSNHKLEKSWKFKKIPVILMWIVERIRCPVPSVSLTSALNIQHKPPWNPPERQGEFGRNSNRAEIPHPSPLADLGPVVFSHCPLIHQHLHLTTDCFIPQHYISPVRLTVARSCTECSVEQYNETCLLSKIILSPAGPVIVSPEGTKVRWGGTSLS